MTREETLAIMALLKAAYPNYYKDMKRADAEGVVNLWATMFADEPADLVAMAVKAHIASDVKGFAPHVGAIKEAIIRIQQPKEMTEMEAWALVERAISGASMSPQSMMYRNGVTDGKTSAERNFDKLPPLLKRIVGNPGQLAAWGAMNEETVGTVIASNFQRSYRAIAAKEREHMALPSDVCRVMEQIGGAMSMPALEGETL